MMETLAGVVFRAFLVLGGIWALLWGGVAIWGLLTDGVWLFLSTSAVSAGGMIVIWIVGAALAWILSP